MRGDGGLGVVRDRLARSEVFSCGEVVDVIGVDLFEEVEFWRWCLDAWTGMSLAKKNFPSSEADREVLFAWSHSACGEGLLTVLGAENVAAFWTNLGLVMVSLASGTGLVSFAWKNCVTPGLPDFAVGLLCAILPAIDGGVEALV